MPMPQAGDAAPDFVLQDQDGNSVTLSQLAGKNVVLYFYPKDDTPGCTVEACSFRDEHSVLEAAGAVVLGVSADSTASHRKFATKFNLPFPLLADTEHQVSDAYGVWGEKSLYGRKFLGINRATFLIGPDGKVKQVWPKVKVNGHVVEVLAALGAKPSAPVSGGSALEVEAAAPELPAASVKDSEWVDELTPLSGTPLTAPAQVTKFEPAKRKSAATKAPASKAASQDETPAGAAVAVTTAPEKKAAPAKKPASEKKAAPVKTEPVKAAPEKKAAPAQKTSAKKAAPVKKAAAQKTSAKKAEPVKKAAAKKTSVKKAAPVKKVAAKKAGPAKKTSAKKAAPVKKAAAKKASAKKATPAKKTSAKKGASAKKSAPAKKSAAKRK
ncbi:thioredoxin-dependent thiol peroxidase [Myxococcus llanfairpwllgwyngyllgogerychwyrndrobwllllantysiliogogogochensis]|uniref:thioredoxin-dependent peroxiredoxin n=2 Tax=Myxococcus llanfairpwllgwyngyllgogerychwyrndrobwllllantysiliogogogochensis TaxID=2590453 RepID=A0A540X5Z3_9BACT|nr:thioredoxin-dependent thiol peroxidase [Myxococcus llanfairpwllgwyngyllgogerychwyrndrobwllllantysiliogogogochensis]